MVALEPHGFGIGSGSGNAQIGELHPNLDWPEGCDPWLVDWRRIQDKSLEDTMACVICESDRAQPVWRQGRIRIDECKGCGVFFTVERPTEKEMMGLYDGNTLIRERPDTITKNEECKPAWKMAEHAQLLDRISDLGVSGGALLDVGCFSGLFLSNASKRGFDVSGVEPNHEAYLHVRNFWGFEVAHGTLSAADLASERFSVVSFLDVIEHVPDPVSELKEALRLLRPGGLLLLATPNVKGLPQRAVKTKRWFTREPFCPIDDVPWHLWGFTRESLALCVEKAGFTVKEVSWLEPSLLSTNDGAGSSSLKRIGLRLVAKVSKPLGMSDRMALFALKPIKT